MIILTCLRCNEAQSPLQVATNVIRPQACMHCGNNTFQISAATALEIYKMEKDNQNMHMIIDGAYG